MQVTGKFPSKRHLGVFGRSCRVSVAGCGGAARSSPVGSPRGAKPWEKSRGPGSSAGVEKDGGSGPHVAMFGSRWQTVAGRTARDTSLINPRRQQLNCYWELWRVTKRLKVECFKETPQN